MCCFFAYSGLFLHSVDFFHWTWLGFIWIFLKCYHRVGCTSISSLISQINKILERISTLINLSFKFFNHSTNYTLKLSQLDLYFAMIGDLNFYPFIYFLLIEVLSSFWFTQRFPWFSFFIFGDGKFHSASVCAWGALWWGWGESS